MLCSRGYSDTLAGVAAALIIVSGFLASFPLGYLSIKCGKLILITKVGDAILTLYSWLFLLFIL